MHPLKPSWLFTFWLGHLLLMCWVCYAVSVLWISVHILSSVYCFSCEVRRGGLFRGLSGVLYICLLYLDWPYFSLLWKSFLWVIWKCFLCLLSEILLPFYACHPQICLFPVSQITLIPTDSFLLVPLCSFPTVPSSPPCLHTWCSVLPLTHSLAETSTELLTWLRFWVSSSQVNFSPVFLLAEK